ncbi:MAG TPA: SDR family oxidoreductase [Acidimicrobiales bacterium]
MTAPMSQPPLPGEAHGLLTGKVVVVTAAAGAGIGFATARRCLEEGASVMMSDKHERRLHEATLALAAAGPTPPLGVACDVTAPGGVERLMDASETAFGPVDVVVNNAGLGGTQSVAAMSDTEWSSVIDVSLNGTFRATRAALRLMIPRGRGVIVNLASVTGWRAEAGQAHYGAAKAGVMALTRCAALEAAPHGVRVNAVAPTLTAHPFLVKVTDPEVLEMWARRQPQNRAAEPFEIANVIVFVASDYAGYLTGEVISVGGQHP